MGGPIGNTNAVKNGNRSKRPGVVLARLGRKYKTAYADALRIRRELVALVGATSGGPTLLQAARIQTACRLELSVRIAEQSLREQPDMAVEEIRAQRSCITQWCSQRDNLLMELIGDCKASSDPWAALKLLPVGNKTENA